MRTFRIDQSSGRRRIRRRTLSHRAFNLGTVHEPIPASLSVPRRPGGLVLLPAEPSPAVAQERFALARAGLATIRFDLRVPEPAPIVDAVRSAREMTGPAVPFGLYGVGAAAAPSLEAASHLGGDLAGVVARATNILPPSVGFTAPTLLVEEGPLAERRAIEWFLHFARAEDRDIAHALLALLGHRSGRAIARRILAASAIAAGTLLSFATPASAAVTATVSGTTLTVTADAADNVTITCDAGDIKVNTANPGPGAGAKPCAPITAISVTASGSHNNTIDLAGVTSAAGYTSVASVTIDAGAGNDAVTGSGFADSIVGGAGDDSLTGGAGNDTLTGGDGNDSLTGGDGTDRVVESGDVNFTLTNTSLTGQGTDTLATIEQARLTGGAGNNNLNAGAFTAGPVTLEGGGGADTLTGGSGNDSILGEGGNDTLTGANGNDTITGGDGTDRLTESGDVNFTLATTILTGFGNDNLSGIEEASLTGGAGANILNAAGFTGPVTLTGGGGNDTLTGGSASDNLAGSEGTDHVSQTVGGNQTLTNTSLSGRGTDNISGVEQASLTGDGGPNAINAAGFSGATTLTGGSGNDNLVGGSSSDRIVGQAGNDRERGGAGGDTLNGGGGKDRLFGGGARDTLKAGSGNDTLRGGAGADVLRDGPGKDSVKR